MGNDPLAAEQVEAAPLQTDSDKYRLLLENERVRAVFCEIAVHLDQALVR